VVQWIVSNHFASKLENAETIAKEIFEKKVFQPYHHSERSMNKDRGADDIDRKDAHIQEGHEYLLQIFGGLHPSSIVDIIVRETQRGKHPLKKT
jgi:hypothetical protein